MNRPTLRRFWRYLFRVPRCAACGRLLRPHEALRSALGADILCPTCRGEWEREKLEFCPVCGEAQVDCRCMPPLLRDSGAAALVHLGAYTAESCVGRVVLHLKDVADRPTAAFAAAQLCHAIRRLAAECGIAPSDLCVTYLPRSRRARRFVGHDQAELLAREIAKALGAPMRPLLRRTRESAEQKALRGETRSANVRGVFALRRGEACAGQVILLVDDVVTTGASLAEAVCVLGEAGAETVLCATIGLTPWKNTKIGKNKKTRCFSSGYRV